jgi:hypothetical protein
MWVFLLVKFADFISNVNEAEVDQMQKWSEEFSLQQARVMSNVHRPQSVCYVC